MRLRALIFDVDGTLAETEEAHRAAFNQTFAEAGLDWHWSRADYARLLRTTGGKERMARYRDETGCGPDDAGIAALHGRKTARYGEILASGGLALRPGVAELIGTARAAGLKIAVATTTNRPNVEALCRACFDAPMARVFDVVAAGDEVAAKKPAPDVFRLALERLALDAAECIAFEDSTNGLRSALGAGLRVLVTPSAYTAAEDFTGATWVRDTLERAALPGPLAFGATVA
ncbi:HAD-IA family hydrolase [Thetidibacter halocola]|uniref:HAD-IA family hydrolase n=1 Tax=Thetidibacter halocola TaxID=2827239 RepID=A0A8J7WAL8_9RHOB|nr:HAD-IA family hydrolase [Thetidibacter halocola]MBS0124010.1 HAD-IA family hydrolase [Thetidibacter halocola]